MKIVQFWLFLENVKIGGLGEKPKNMESSWHSEVILDNFLISLDSVTLGSLKWSMYMLYFDYQKLPASPETKNKL